MHRIDGEGATSDGKFTEGNPATGSVATTVTADWCNAIQEEIINVLAAAGITPTKADNTQLRQAIQSLISGGGVAVSAAGVSIADAGDYFTGTEVEAALQQLAQKLYAGTINANQIRRSVVKLDGAAHQSNAAHLESIVEISHTADATYTVLPDSSLNLPIGAAIQIAQSGAGKVNIAGGAGVTILRAASFKAVVMQQHAIAVLIKTAANTWRLGGMLEAA